MLFRSFLRREAEQLRNLTWLNRVDQPTKWLLMKSADVGLVPSLHEPFGIVALEWMALEVPLMTTGVDGLADFTDRRNSIVVKYDVDAWSDALKRFKRSPKMVERALDTARKHSWRRAADDTTKVYERVMNYAKQPGIAVATRRA